MNREMANKIEDDVSLMAHEGSDEEQGKHEKSQSRKKAWQEMDESR